MKVTLLCSLLLFCYSLAETRVTKEHTNVFPAPQEWLQDRRADPDHITSITIAITQTNLDLLEEKFWEVSNPRSSHYAKYMSLQQVNALVSPTQQSTQAVTQWLRAHGIADHALAQSGDFITARAPVQRLEQLLGTSYFVYKHATSGEELVRALGSYSVPADLASHVDFVAGLTHFPKKITTILSKPTGDNDITPIVIKKFFNINPTTVGTAVNNSQAVAQFLGQYYAPTDLANFQKQYLLYITENKWEEEEEGHGSRGVTKVVGPNLPNRPGVEASLDIEYIMGIAPKVPTWFVYTAGSNANQEPFLDWIVNMSSTPDAPYVHSISYGDVEKSVSVTYVARVDAEFMKYGLMGRSIIFASGDDGTGCVDVCKRFAPNWPASSAFVTSVGGIYLDGSSAVADQIASGGFSNIFPQPSYQSSVVPAYVSAHSSPASSFYNASGRAIPDIASFSENVLIEYQGGLTYVGGTSCAAPVISGVISLLNDARLAAGKAPLGFLNPFLYQTLAAHPDAFIDITQGNNQNGCCKAGFEAATGWDPITGVGAPNFANLKTYALAV